MAPTIPLPGIKVTVGGREFVVPSLKYGEHKRLRAQGVFDATKGFDFARYGDDDFEVAKTALLHNYPTLADAELEDLAPRELAELARAAVFATMGLTEVPSPEAQSPETASTGATASSPSAS